MEDKKIKLTINKKILSIFFLILALFMLGSVSYAYFVANVEGNNTAKKTAITTGTASLKFDGTKIIGTNKMVPGEQHETTFTVQNTGTVDTIYNIDMIDVSNTYVTKRDLVYKITSTNDGGEKQETELPSESGTILRNIYIKSGVTQTYTITVIFKDDREIQNDNEGKSFGGKIQISSTQDELSAIVLQNNELKSSEGLDFSNGSPYCEFDTSKWVCTGDYISNGDGLYYAPDDDGISYYFRGDKALINNNVTFANKNWYIIRINGDGTIRLILKDRITYEGANSFEYNEYMSTELQHKLVGFTYDNDEGKECIKEHPCQVTYDKATNEFSNANFGGTNVNIKNVLEGWYKENLNSYDDNIAYGSFCNDISYGGGTDNYSDNYLTYGAHKRLISQAASEIVSPTLICPEQVDRYGNTRSYGGLYKTKVGLPTADELNMGGFRTSVAYFSEKNYLKLGNFHYYTISPVGSNYNAGIFYGQERAYIDGVDSYVKEGVVPVINLKPDVKFTYNENSQSAPGSSTNPLVIK